MKEIIIQEIKGWNLGIREQLEGGKYTRFRVLSEEDVNDIAEEMFISIKRNLTKENNDSES